MGPRQRERVSCFFFKEEDFASSTTFSKNHPVALSRAHAVWLIGSLTILGGAASPANVGVPIYDASGHLIMPVDYREWVFLSSGIDMSYTGTPTMPSGHMFDNVFAAPAAYAEFRKTGRWPDGTMLVLENRGGASKGSINKLGRFQTSEVMGVEAHVKDEARFAGGWGFFAFDDGKPSQQIPYRETCYTCHRAHAAVDTTFVQFYPTLLPVARKRGTLSALFLAETEASPAK